MLAQTKPEILLGVEETSRILTITALFHYLHTPSEESEQTTSMLRRAVEILAEQIESNVFLDVFDKVIELEDKMLKKFPKRSNDETENAIRERQAWRGEKHLRYLAQDSDNEQELLAAAQYLQYFWGISDDAEPRWYTVDNLMFA